MKRLLVIGVIACITFIGLVGCKNEKVDTLDKVQEQVKEEVVEEDSNYSNSVVNKNASKEKKDNVSSKEEFFESMKSNLSKEEMNEMFVERRSKIEEILYRDKIRYTQSYTTLNYKRDGTCKEMEIDTFAYNSVDIANGDPYNPYMFLLSNYYLDEDSAKPYVDGTDSFDITNTNFPEIFKASTNMTLDTNKLNEIISKAFKGKIGKRNKIYDGVSSMTYATYVTLDEDLDEVILNEEDKAYAFMCMEVSNSGVKITLKIPYKNKLDLFNSNPLAEKKVFKEFVKINLNTEERKSLY